MPGFSDSKRLIHKQIFTLKQICQTVFSKYNYMILPNGFRGNNGATAFTLAIPKLA